MLLMRGDLDHRVAGGVADGLAGADVFLAERLDHPGAGGVAVGEDAGEVAFADQCLGEICRKGRLRVRKITPVETDRQSGDLPVARRRVLAARGLCRRGVEAGDAFHRHRSACGKRCGVPQSQRPHVGHVKRPLPQSGGIAFAAHTGRFDMPERVRSLVVERRRIGRAADAEGIQHEKECAGHVLGAFYRVDNRQDIGSCADLGNSETRMAENRRSATAWSRERGSKLGDFGNGRCRSCRMLAFGAGIGGRRKRRRTVPGRPGGLWRRRRGGRGPLGDQGGVFKRPFHARGGAGCPRLCSAHPKPSRRAARLCHLHRPRLCRCRDPLRLPAPDRGARRRRRLVRFAFGAGCPPAGRRRCPALHCRRPPGQPGDAACASGFLAGCCGCGRGRPARAD